MSCVYILQSQKTKKLYVGASRENDPEKRLKAHNAGRTRSTKFARPWVLLHYEVCDSYTIARKKELFLKSGQGRKWFKERWLSGRRRQSCPPEAGPPPAEKL